MKNNFNLVLVLLLFVVLGCTCPTKLSDTGNKVEDAPDKAETTTPKKGEDTPKDNVSMAKYNAIKTGMKRSEVEKIMGSSGTEYYSGKGGGVSFVSVKWVGDNFKTILVSFQNDKVTSKSQVGLD